MFRKKLFSIIEVMTVVLIVLLLISLTIPIFVNLKMNARTSICKNQMRQIGSLITFYTSDNGGYLPNDDISDCGVKQPAWPKMYPNDNLYNNWNGHLLPYLDLKLPNRYTRYADVNIQLVNGVNQAVVLPALVAPITNLNTGWVVIDEAVSRGGYQDLKLFICPEIHSNANDIDVSNKFNGLKIPRIALILAGTGTGTPSTYLANGTFFGKNLGWSPPRNSFRLDQIDNISERAYVLEGGLANGSAWTYARDVYYNLGRMPYEGYDLGGSHPGDCSRRFIASAVGYQKLSYVHDNYQQFWISTEGNIPRRDMPNYVNTRREMAIKFNQRYEGKAYMIPCTIDDSSYDPPYTIVSYINPEKGDIFKDFLKENPTAGTDWGNFVEYSDEPNEFHYLVGNMNVLFGDNSVTTKDLGWLSCNRIQIGMPISQ